MYELTELLNNPEDHYPGNFDTPQRANALLTGLCQDAATEIERLNRFNAELVEALKLADALLYGANMNATVVKKKIDAALAKATGETK